MDSELVIVTGITASAAVIPQVLTWWQNRQRDEWERKRETFERERLTQIDEHEQRHREEERQRANQLAVVEATKRCTRAISEFHAQRAMVGNLQPALLEAMNTMQASFEDLALLDVPSIQSNAARRALSALKTGHFKDPWEMGDLMLEVRAELLGMRYDAPGR